ncbi:MAG: tetratricopeptide repeat protein, partial [bacterium]
MALLLVAAGATLCAAESGSPSSEMAAVKAAYDSGNYDQAVRLLRSAAERGDPHAECGMGVMYEHGRGVSKDLKRAVLWYRKAAAQKDGRAENSLGWLYAHGKGVPYDARQALAWFQDATRDSRDAWGRALAWNNLGNTYFFGHGVPKNYYKAADAYARAAALGNPESENKMGYLCEHGLGLAHNLKQAAVWYHKAAAQGFSMGQNNLAYLYETGHGVLLS